MRPHACDSRPVTCVAEDRPDRLRRQRAVRRERAQEHLAVLTMRSAAEKMLDQRLADIVRERETVELCAFPVDRQLAGAPIDIIQRERHDLGRPQPEAREQHQDA